jgi:hypothetical protein
MRRTGTRCQGAAIRRRRADGVAVRDHRGTRNAHDAFTRDDHVLEDAAMLYTILVVILVLALIGALPAWPYSSGWGYYPTGGVGILLLVLIVLLVSGRV